MKTTNPKCLHDKSDCEPKIDLDGYLDCRDCPRYCNGVRETGGMPILEMVFNKLKQIKL